MVHYYYYVSETQNVWVCLVTFELAHLTSLEPSEWLHVCPGQVQPRNLRRHSKCVVYAPPVSRLASKPKLSPSLEAKKLVSFPQIEISTDRRAELNIWPRTLGPATTIMFFARPETHSGRSVADVVIYCVMVIAIQTFKEFFFYCICICKK